MRSSYYVHKNSTNYKIAKGSKVNDIEEIL